MNDKRICIVINSFILFDFGVISPKPIDANIVIPEKNKLTKRSKVGSGTPLTSSSVTHVIAIRLKAKFSKRINTMTFTIDISI